MSEKKSNDDASSNSVVAKPKSNMPILLAIVIVGIALQFGGMYYFSRVRSAGTATPAAKEKEVSASDEERVTPLGAETEMGATTAETPLEVTVNIAGTEGERFLKAAIVMEYLERGGAEGKKKEGHGEGKGAPGLSDAIKERLPKYRDYLNEKLSAMSMTELTAPDTKEKLKREIIKMVNNSLPAHLGTITNVYFTQFIIQ